MFPSIDDKYVSRKVGTVTMNIGFDFESYQIARNRGIGNYAINLCNSFFRLFPQNNYSILLWEEENIVDKFNIDDKEQINVVIVNSDDISEKGLAIAKFIDDNRLDVYWDIAAIIRKDCFISKRNDHTLYVSTVYDLIPYIFKEDFFYDVDQYIKYYERMLELKKFDVLFSISESTRNDVINYCDISEYKIFNIYMSGNDNINSKKDDYNSIFNNIDIESKYYLCVSGNGYHKNLLRLVRGYLLACESCDDLPQLIIVASLSDTYSQIAEIISEKNAPKNKILFPGFVSDDELNYLYSHAFWEICPSLYEGFGMPILECWNHSVPVISSTGSAVGEIAGDAAYIIDPNSISSIAEAFLKTNSFDDKERNLFIKKGLERKLNFSWDKTVENAYKILGSKLDDIRSDNESDYESEIRNQINDERKKAEKIWGVSNTSFVRNDNTRMITEYPILMKWLVLYEKNRSIDKFFYKKGIRSVALYGLGFWGVRILKALIKSDIEVKCVIDKRARFLNSAGCGDLLKIINLHEQLPDVDCILIAPVYGAEELKNIISKHYDCDIYDLNDIFALI